MTISELAQNIGVSKTAIRKKYNAIPDFADKYITKAPNGMIEINPDGCKLIAETFQKPAETTENKAETVSANHENQVSFTMIEILRQQLEEKDSQIRAQQEQISQLTAALEHTTTSLQAAQALHAGTMQQQLLPESSEEVTDGDKKEEKRRRKHWWSKR